MRARALNQLLEQLGGAFEQRVIGLFDDDREGANQFLGLKRFNKGIDDRHRKHASADVHAILLPAPPNRNQLVSPSPNYRLLTLEHYFDDQVLCSNSLKGKEVYEGTGLFEITGNKGRFAEVAKQLPQAAFGNFADLFTRIDTILRLPSNH